MARRASRESCFIEIYSVSNSVSITFDFFGAW